MSRTYAIADLHGRFDLLEAALTAIARRESGTVVFLGDYIDRGHESRQIIERLIAGPSAPWEWICLAGNHETIMLECIRDPEQIGWWLENGGGQTLVSYGHAPTGSVDVTVIPEAHLAWLAARPLLYVQAHRIFVHAAIDPDRPLAAQRPDFVQWHRYGRGEDRPAHGRHVVHGHDADPHGPLLLQHRTNLDVWAVRTGRLVVAIFDDAVPGGPLEIVEVGAGAGLRAP